jgi:N12 class adenine-specific DNA methylase
MNKKSVSITKLNNIYGQVLSDHPTLMKELYSYLSVYVDGYRFMPKYKMGIWDGKIYFMERNGKFPLGLLKQIYEFLKFYNDISITIDSDIINKNTDIEKDLAEVTNKWMSDAFVPYYYQFEGALKALTYKRGILEHATSAGKSLTMSMIVMYALIKEMAKKCLILVPSLGLVEQLKNDFIEYGVPPDYIGTFSGLNKDTDEPIIISTWQSMSKNPEMVKNFETIITDECLHPETLITMGDNTLKKIKDIKIGDIVKTINENNKLIENKPVKKVHKNISSTKNNMYKITLENGKEIKITGNHKVFLKSGIWKKVEDLTLEDEIESINN